MRVQAFPHGLVVTVGPTLLPGEVTELERRLRVAGHVGRLVIDLASARSVDDSVVARLAEAVGRITPLVEFRGLTLHQRRLLRYLGHTAPEPARPSGVA